MALQSLRGWCLEWSSQGPLTTRPSDLEVTMHLLVVSHGWGSGRSSSASWKEAWAVCGPRGRGHGLNLYAGLWGCTVAS